MKRTKTSQPLRKFGRVFRSLPTMALAAGLGWFASSGSAFAQAPAAENGVQRTYLNKQSIQLPIEIDGSYRSQISGLMLYMKEGANGAWSLRDKAPPMQTSFATKVTRDGEYWFRIVAVDKKGKSHPDDLNKDLQDAVVVVIDSQPPALDIGFVGTTADGHILQAYMSDANPDAMKFRFFFQTRDQVWRPLDPIPGRPYAYCVPAQAAITNLVKLSAEDLAGNAATRVFNLGELTPQTPQTKAPGQLPQSIAAPQQAATPSPSIVQSAPILPTAPTTPGIQITESSPDLSPQSSLVPASPFQPQAVNPPVRSVVAQLPTFPPANEVQTVSVGTLARQASPTNLQIVNNPRVFLNYAFENVGASGVGRIEIWASRDQGQTWTKCAEDAKGRSPAEVSLPGEGLYGLKMVVANGRGFGAQPPQAGDPADWWIEVDTTKLKAAITGVRSGIGSDAGTLQLYWRAEDKNLGDTPIELYFGQSRDGPWQLIGKGLKNLGQYRWTPPQEAGAQAYLRLMVRDKAGNTAFSETVQPVPLDDLSRPKVRLIGISTAPPSPSLPPVTSSVAPPVLSGPPDLAPLEVSSIPVAPTMRTIVPASFTIETK